MEKKLTIQSHTGETYIVHKYILDNEGKQHVWCNDWYGHHVIGVDCEWVQTGAGWIKASERLPERHVGVIVRNMKTWQVKVMTNYGHIAGWDVGMDRQFMWDNTEWLDESAGEKEVANG
jgi:hypothetical protein